MLTAYWKLATPTEVNGQVKSTEYSAFKHLPVAAGINVTTRTQ